MNTKIRVAVLLGGDSSERPISFKSGKEMAEALSPERFNITIFDVSTEETRVNHPVNWANVAGKLRHACHPVDWNRLVTALYTSPFDVVLPALHGGRGEDGTLQTLLEVAGIPYVGSGPRASTIALDKQVCKAYMRDFGIPVPAGKVINNVAELDAVEFNGPCCVKPNAGGSSVAVTILREPNAQALQTAVEAALEDGSQALIEELVEGVEVTAAVIGQGKDARVLPLIEIVPQSEAGFYDYEAKYAPGGSQHLTPPRITPEAQERIAEYSLAAHAALGCRGVSRSDFIVSADGTPYFLETNTLPGMTETSLVPDAARAAGISFEQLVEQLVMQALPK